MTQPTFTQTFNLAKVWNHRRIKFRKWFLHLKTSGISIQIYFNLSRRLEFSDNSHWFEDKACIAKQHKSETRTRKRYQSGPEPERRNLEKFLYTQQNFSTGMDRESPSSSFLQSSLFHFPHVLFKKNRCVKKVKKYFTKKRSCCFNFISGVSWADETQKYDTNNKRSFDSSENKKQRCLNF